MTKHMKFNILTTIINKSSSQKVVIDQSYVQDSIFFVMDFRFFLGLSWFLWDENFFGFFLGFLISFSIYSFSNFCSLIHYLLSLFSMSNFSLYISYFSVPLSHPLFHSITPSFSHLSLSSL